MSRKDAEIAAVAAELDGMLDELAETVAALSAILARRVPAPPKEKAHD